MDEHTQRLISGELEGTLQAAERDQLMRLMMDNPAVAEALQRAEQALAAGLLDDEPVELGATRRYNWIANAASLLIGVALTLSLGQFVPDSSGTLSASVHYLDTMRGSAPQLTTVFVHPDDRFVTLVTAPVYDNYDALDVEVSVFRDEPERLFSADDTAWTSVWSGRSTLGNKDSLAVTLPAAQLRPGIYRLSVLGVAMSPPLREPNVELLFQTRYTQQPPP